MARKNGVKRLLMYVIVIIGALFVGFLAFFFARNEETIAFDLNQGEIIYLNAGNTKALPLKHLKPSNSTTVKIESSNEDVVRYQENTKTLYANGGGVASITITTSNKDFGPFKFDVFVGDGTTENPWYISTSKQFSNIGKGIQELTGENFLSTHAYELIGDIDLGNLYADGNFWTPISEFSGSLQGEGKSVLNLKINSDNLGNVGLFGKLTETALVENIHFANVEINADNAVNVGIIAGVNNGFIGKVSIVGAINSSSPTAIVGGVVGLNEYISTRPVLNMVKAKVAFATKGLTGGLVGSNKAGIVFNSSIVVTDIDVYSAVSTMGLYNTTYSIEPTFGFGGVVGRNQAGIYTENQLRQTANKNVFVKFEKVSAINTNPLYSSKIAMVAFENLNATQTHDYYIANHYINVIVLANTTLAELGNNLSIETKTNVRHLTDGTFAEIQTVEELGLTSVWSIDKASKMLNIDFEFSYENHQISTPGEVIIEKQGVIDAINKITSTTTAISFKVDLNQFTENVETINEEKVLIIYGHEITGTMISTQWGFEDGLPKTENNWTRWKPIASNNKGYIGEFIVTGGRVIIKNLLIEEGFEVDEITYYGLFSNIIEKNTIIQNLSVENVKINADASKQKQYAGGFAGGISSAYVEGVVVDGIEINNADVAGFAFGYANSGTIKNISVGSFIRFTEEIEAETDIDEFTYLTPPNRITNTTAYQHSVNYGGFAGYVSVSLENIAIHYGLISHNGTGDARLGGFTGTQNAEVLVKDIKVNYGVLINNNVKGKGYAGGISGYVAFKGIIEYSFSLANIDFVITVEEANAGGIAGYLASDGIIRNSFAGDQSSGQVSAKNVGGIVSENNGSIFQSYSAGVYKGHNVGGIAYQNNGKIESVLITGTLEGVGTSASNTVAGIAVYMPKGSLAKYVISTASISGQGSTALYAETRSTVRYTGVESVLSGIFNGKVFNGTHQNGDLENYLIVGYGQAQRQRGIIGSSSFWITVYESNEDELRLQGGQNPYAKTGFTDLENFIWKFETGKLPRLINVAINPYVLVEEEAGA